MQLQYKTLAIIVTVAMALGGFIANRYTSNREVIKTQVIDHTITQDHVVTIVKEIDRPDGSKERTTTIDDSSIKNNTSVSKTEDKKASLPPNWLVTGGVGLELSGIPSMVYQVGVSKRILGPIFVGAWGAKGRDISGGLSATFEF